MKCQLIGLALVLLLSSQACSGKLTVDDGRGGTTGSGGGAPDAGATCSDPTCVAHALCTGKCAETDCSASVLQNYGAAAGESCADEWLGLFNCYLAAGQDACDVGADGTCQHESDGLQACMPSYHEGIDDAGINSAQGPCDGSFTSKTLNWSVHCVLDGPAFDCTCTSGPQIGNTFQLNNCLGGWLQVAEPHCK